MSSKWKTVRVFISYSHRGNGPEWKAKLLRALHVFEQQHLLDVWQDGKIRVSSYWDDNIRQAMGKAALAVVLLTREALKSEYIISTEFPFLSERQKHENLPVFPVICEECNWGDHEWLRATQAPNESNPLSQLSETAQKRIFRKLATDIAEKLSRVALSELPKPEQSLPPDKIYLDKFPITRGPGLREEKLIGREQELALLDLAFSQPGTTIVSLVAWGGVGKTMLVQHWLQRLQREDWHGVQRVYAWSFYSQGTKEDRQASEDTFLAHALAWFGVQCEPTLSPWDKGRLLAAAVAHERTLLILDGIEPLQYPPGPMGGQLRAPGVQSLLKQLARKANDTEQLGLCLVTTREQLTDLADFQRRPDCSWGSVLRVDLGNLTDEAGAALLYHAGSKRAGAAEIRADDSELISASQEVDGHALTLNLLGRFLARAHGGDIRRRDLVKFEEADRKEQGGTSFKMLAAFESWLNRSGSLYQQSLAILRILGLFDRPADAGCIGVLRESPVIAGLTDPLFTARKDASTGQTIVQPMPDEDWNTTTSFLADFGLVVIQLEVAGKEALLDCHALIREYFAKQLKMSNQDAWLSANRRVCDYITLSVDKWPNDIVGIDRLVEAAIHGCRLGLMTAVLDNLYYTRIRQGDEQFSTRHIGAFGTTLTLLASLFDKPWFQPSHRLKFEDQMFLMQEASFCLSALGRLLESIELIRTVFRQDIQRNDFLSATQSANLFVYVLLLHGNIQEAVVVSKQGTEYADRVVIGPLLCDVRIYHQFGRVNTAEAFQCAGQWEGAALAYQEAEEIQAQVTPLRPLLGQAMGFNYSDFLLREPERAAWLITQQEQPYIKASPPYSTSLYEGTLSQVDDRAAQTLSWVKEQGLLLEVALYQLVRARIAAYRNLLMGSSGVIPAILPDVELALQGLRQAGQICEMPRGLLTRAWLRFLAMDAVGACADLNEAWDIAERGPMRLYMADIHLYRARLFFREKQYPWKSPQDDLAAAEKLINECGYHRRDEELADAKKAILG
jgi:hypothetical protein